MNINVNLNAEAIWQTLDVKDGTKDGKIEKSIWDSFADITGGNHINNCIEERNALKSINAYLRRASEETINKICEFLGWNNSTENIQEGIKTSDNLLEQIAEDPSMVLETEEGEYEDGSTWKKAKLADGRFVKIDYAQDGSIDVIKVSTNPNEMEGYDGETYDSTEVNYADDGIYTGNHEHSNQMSFDVTSDKYDFTKYQKLAEKIFGANIPEDAKECFRLSTDILNEAANINPKPEVYASKHAGEDCKECKLPNGEYIRVFYDSKGEIEGIIVSYSSEEEELSDGSMGDGAEAYFTSSYANYNANSSIKGWDGEVTSGYDFEELKALAEKIFN